MLIGHHLILDFLKKSQAKNKLAHAYLFVGPAHIGKRTTALAFIQSLIGQDVTEDAHPDVLIIKPGIQETDKGKREAEITIEQIRSVKKQLSLSPHQAEYKVVLIDRAERMNRQAANSLLKTLEEPSQKSLLILISPSAHLLLPTIVSRCQLIKFLPVKAEEIKKALAQENTLPEKDFEKAVSLSAGRPGIACRYLKEPVLLKEQDILMTDLREILKSDLNKRFQYAEQMAKDTGQAKEILQWWLLWFRDLALVGCGCSSLVVYPEAVGFYKQIQDRYPVLRIKLILEKIKETILLLNNSSINGRLALEALMLDI